ncbi:MAG: Gar1/Naf1 family protein [Candidatus Hydrothermarchaeaceae archaeon]
MKPLGKFSHFTKAGNIVLRGDEIPTLFSIVTDGEKRIGRINDVIGPMAKPYIIVKPNRGLGKDDLLRVSKGAFYEQMGRRTRFGKKGRVYRRLPRVQKQKLNKGL